MSEKRIHIVEGGKCIKAGSEWNSLIKLWFTLTREYYEVYYYAVNMMIMKIL